LAVGDLKHLILIDDHPERLRGELLEFGEQIRHPRQAVLAVDEIVHHARSERPGSVEGDDRNQLLEVLGAQLRDELGHTGGLDLKHALRVATRQQRVGLRIVERHVLDPKVRVVGLANSAPRIRDRGEGLEPEEVELDQPELFHAAHVELGQHVARLRVAIQRHLLDQRPIADHDTGRVGRGVARQALETARGLEQLRDLPIRFGARA